MLPKETYRPEAAPLIIRILAEGSVRPGAAGAHLNAHGRGWPSPEGQPQLLVGHIHLRWDVVVVLTQLYFFVMFPS